MCGPKDEISANVGYQHKAGHFCDNLYHETHETGNKPGVNFSCLFVSFVV